MLAKVSNYKRVEWENFHFNDRKRSVRLRPKNSTIFLARDGFCTKRKTSLFCFQHIMDAKRYLESLQQHVGEVNEILGKKWRCQKITIPNHTSRVAPEVTDWQLFSPDPNSIENL
ncbi:hypothetical protein G9A89_010939 [Geosiphon pyriformis]|nr:hypothetical protein G9A89_010939 [Geosiphon pyriformis]